jgi:multidrug resistance efflux pump
MHKESERSRRAFQQAAASEQEHELARTNFAQKERGLRNAEAQLQYLKNYVRPEDRSLALAKVRHAEAELELARQRLRDTVLVAPCDGTVLQLVKRVGEGQRLIDNEAAVVFGDLRGLRVRAEIDERYARRLRVGQEAVAFGRGLGEDSFCGRVAAVRPIMGKKAVFSRSATERKDLEVIQVLVDMERAFAAPVGLQVDVKIRN